MLHAVGVQFETIAERARRERVHRVTVWRWIQAQRIEAVRPLGLGPYLIPVQDDDGAEANGADDANHHNRPEGGQRAAPAA